MVKHVELTQQISQIPTRNALGSQTMGILILIGTVSQFEEACNPGNKDYAKMTMILHKFDCFFSG